MILDKLFESRASIENPSVPLTGANLAAFAYGAMQSSSGVDVNLPVALSNSAVWSGLDMVSGDCSKFPCNVWRSDSSGRELAEQHNTYVLLHDHTGEMTSNLWVRLMVAQAMIYGNAYSEIGFADRQPIKMTWHHRDYVTPARMDDGRIVYRLRVTRRFGEPRQEERLIEERNMFHLRGLAFTELGGLSLIDFARNTIGRQIAAELFGDDLHNNSAVPNGFLKHKTNLSPEAQSNLVAQFEDRHAGHGKRHRIGVLEEDMDWVPAGMTAEDAMLIDSLKFGIKDIARYFSIPPHKLGDDSKVAYNSISEENRAYFDGTLCRWLNAIEREAKDKLFTEAEKALRQYEVEFDTDQFLRSDEKTRMESTVLGWTNGLLSLNQALDRLRFNPVDRGDSIYMFPANMRLVDKDTMEEISFSGEPEEPEGESLGNGDDEQVPDENQPPERSLEGIPIEHTIGLRDLVESQLLRLAKRVHRSACAAAKKPNKFLAFVNELENDHGSVIREAFDPLEAFCGRASADMCAELLGACQESFLSASECQADELPEKIDKVYSVISKRCRDLASDWIAAESRS